MNAIIFLAHFCETHGPSILLCTQEQTSKDSETSLLPFTNCDETEDLQTNKLTSNFRSRTDFGSITASYFSMVSKSISNLRSAPSTPNIIGSQFSSRRPSVSQFSIKSKTTNAKPPSSSVKECDCCYVDFTEFGENINGFVTEDKEHNLTYVTSRHPDQPKLYTVLRHSCVRSLSCEFCTGRQGPVFFGDEKHGYTFTYMFNLYDKNSRGSKRFYSFNVLMTDRLYLVNNYTFLTNKFYNFTKFLQSKIIIENTIGSKPENEKVLNSAQSNISSTSINSTTYLRRRTSGKKKILKLQELLNMPHLIPFIHYTFTLVLNDTQKRIVENTQNDFKIWEEPTTVFLETLPVDNNNNNLQKSPINSLFDIYQKIGLERFRKFLYNFAIGNQVVVKCDCKEIFNSTVDILKDVLPKLCLKISESDVYEHIWMYNILKLPLSSDIPEYVDLNSLCVLEIKKSQNDLEIKFSFGEDEPLVSNSKFSGFIDTIIKTTQSCKDLLLPLFHKVYRLKLINVKEEWTCKAKMFAQLTNKKDKNSLSNSSNIEKNLKKILDVLRVNTSDLPIIKFLATAFKPSS